MKNKKKILAAATLLMTTTATATTFGTFQQQEIKETGGEPVEYKIGMVNLGQEPLKVNIEASETGLASLNLEQSMNLGPSEISSDPEGRNWYALGNGSYAKITEYSFTAVARNFRNTNFTLDITAETNNSGETGPYKQIILERSYTFTLVNESYSKGLIQFQSDEETEEQEEKGQAGNLTINSSQNRTEDQKTIETTEKQEEGLPATTLALLAGLTVSLAYILRMVVL
jgi:hypothetical protein